MSTTRSLGDAPIEPEFMQVMNGIAKGLDDVLNPGLKRGSRKVGFCLMVFHMGDEGRCNYVSNADRLDMVTLLREQLARLEGRVAEPSRA